MSWQVRYTEEARLDLRAILDYISNEFLEPGSAVRLVQQITSEANSLDQMVMRYPTFPEEPWHSQGLRYFPVKNYLVFYYPDEVSQTVHIVRVIYGGRDIKNQLNEILNF